MQKIYLDSTLLLINTNFSDLRCCCRQSARIYYYIAISFYLAKLITEAVSFICSTDFCLFFFFNWYLILSLYIRFSVVIYILYWTVTVFCILYKILTASKISIRVENLFLINIISLYIAVYLSILVDAFEISLLNLRYIYNSVKLITEAFATAYIDLSATTETKELINLSIQIFELTVNFLLYII